MKNRKSSNGLMQIAVSVGALVLLALLISNVVIMLMASNLNNSACRDAAEIGAQAYDVNTNLRDIQSAVCSAINKRAFGGFFISNPILAELKCYSDSSNGDKRKMLAVSTVVCVRLPAPFLVLFAKAEDGRLLLNAKCIVELKPTSVSSAAL